MREREREGAEKGRGAVMNEGCQPRLPPCGYQQSMLGGTHTPAVMGEEAPYEPFLSFPHLHSLSLSTLLLHSPPPGHSPPHM